MQRLLLEMKREERENKEKKDEQTMVTWQYVSVEALLTTYNIKFNASLFSPHKLLTGLTKGHIVATQDEYKRQ